jgi:alpha-galactosidase
MPMKTVVAGALVALLGAAPEGRLKVYILAGQSNMEGKAKVSLLETQLARPETRETFAHLKKDGRWIEREDVRIKFFDRMGPLTVGYGSPGCVGPELEFGLRVGDRRDEPVLLIKTAWGGRSLYRDFRPPSSGLPADDVLAKQLENARKRKPETTPEEIRAAYGASYRAMLAEVKATLADLKRVVPDYDGKGYELAGFAWFQGWNDMIDGAATAEYAANLANFIRDVRKDLGAPGLPFAVGQMGVDGPSPGAKTVAFKAAQAAGVAAPEFAGNVALVKTDVFWDMDADAVFKKGWKQNLEEWNRVGSDFPYHYLGSHRTYGAIGRALADALLAMAPPK